MGKDRSQVQILPAYAESHGCKPVDECEAGYPAIVSRDRNDGGYASAWFHTEECEDTPSVRVGSFTSPTNPDGYRGCSIP